VNDLVSKIFSQFCSLENRVTRPGRILARRRPSTASPSNARIEHRRSEQQWASVSMNFGPQNCGAVRQTSVEDQGAARMIEDYYDFPTF
jgi:hypothetical protein